MLRARIVRDILHSGIFASSASARHPALEYFVNSRGLSETHSGYPRYYCCAGGDACLYYGCPDGAGDNWGAPQSPGPAFTTHALGPPICTHEYMYIDVHTYASMRIALPWLNAPYSAPRGPRGHLTDSMNKDHC